MTKKLKELFDVEPTRSEDVEEPTSVQIADASPEEATQDALSNLDKINSALPAVKGLEASDSEMDELATKAVESYNDLMNLGMNVEARYASDILSVASNMLGHAITAKTAKANKKLKMIELQLKNRRLDQYDSQKDPNEFEAGEGKLLDRNEILKALREGNQNSSDDK